MNESYGRMQLTEFCKLLYDRNLTTSAGGNMSVRLNESEVLITPSGKNKGLLSMDDFIVVDMEGKMLSKGKPSIETKMHLALYKNNPETQAIIHCHPLYCIAASMGGKFKADLTPEGVLLLGDVPIIPYKTPGTEELANSVAEHSKSNAIILSRHGAITQGKTLEEAFNRMEELEFQAKLQITTKKAKSLSKQEKESLLGKKS